MIDDFVLLVVIIHAAQIAAVVAAVAVAARFFRHRPFVVRCLWLVVLVKCLTPPLVSSQVSVFSWVNGPWMSRSLDRTEEVHALLTVGGDTDVPSANEEFATTNLLPEGHPFDGQGAFSTSYADRSMPLVADGAGNAGFFLPEASTAMQPIPAALNSAAPFPWLTVALLATSMTGFLVIAIRYVRCVRAIRRHRKPSLEDHPNTIVEGIARKLKLNRSPQVWVTDVCFGPAVMGVMRPTIVLPRILLENLTDEQLHPVIAHELIHIRRGDLWVGMLQAAAQCLWWFWPPVWLANRQLSRSTEHCCDEDVIRVLGSSPKQYARSLLAVIECKHHLRSVPVFPGMKPVEITSQRMERIMSLTQGSRPRMSLLSFIAMLLFAVLVLPGAVTGQPSDETSVLVAPPNFSTAKNEVIDALRDDAVVTTIFDGKSVSSDFQKATEDETDTNELPKPKPRGDRIMFGDGVESDAGVTGDLALDKRCVQVLGAVNQPGSMDISSDKPLSVLQAIANAGGMRAHVDGRMILRRPLTSGDTSIRVLSLRKVILDESANLALSAGDVLVVEEAAIAEAPSAIEQKMMKDLNQQVSFSFTDEPLKEVLRKIATQCGVNLLLDVRTMASASLLDVRQLTSGSSLAIVGGPIDDVTVTLDVKQVTLHVALEKLCGQLGLEFEAVGGLIKIQQPAAVSRLYSARVYNVADLVVPLREKISSSFDASEKKPAAEFPPPPAAMDTGTASRADFPPLVELIRTTIAPNSWNDHAGRIALNEDTLSLVIRQKENVHTQIVELLTQLRQLQDVQIATNFTVVQFKTPEQLSWLEENVEFQKQPGRSPWALLPLDNTTSESSAWAKAGIALASPKITTSVGQEATLEISCVPDGELRLLTAATPLPGDKLLRLSYAAAGRSGYGQRLSEKQVTQIIGNGQTLLVDVTETTKPPAPVVLNNAKRVVAERQKLADRLRGRIIFAITPSVIRVEAEKELIPETP
ncbi:MAG: M56 family metallopeptidase [Planctomycetaceae bacterium]